MILNENERIDYVNDSLSLIQINEGLTFGTDALLLAGYIDRKYKRGIELGSGTGIISMLLLTREKVENALCLEVQEEYALLSDRNAELNNLKDRLKVVHTDIREYKIDAECELVYTNPPYMKTTSGKGNCSSKKNIARHELNGDIKDFLHSGERMLKYGGTFAVVYRPDRLEDLMWSMRESHIEPKRMTFVHADTDSEPSMVLVEGKKGGRCGMKLTCPLIIYQDKKHDEYSDDMKFIMANGRFPDKFKNS